MPLGSAVTLSTDAIAGERERNTLESLLATRLPERALLTGKVLSISLQAWLSALALAFGALVVFNVASIPQGEIVAYPPSVLVAGPVISLLTTVLGTIFAIAVSMTSAAVRQANLRILMISTVLPVLLTIPALLLFVLAVFIFILVGETAGRPVDPTTIELDRSLAIAGFLAAVATLLFANGIGFVIAAARFTRARLMHAALPGRSRSSAQDQALPSRSTSPDTASLSRPIPRIAGFEQNRWEHERPFESAFRDAWIVFRKELVEARGLMREWRGWLVATALVISLMLLQLSAVTSLIWQRDADNSILFWLAMAGALPILIAQRTADVIAGERERNTGEILFSTRLNRQGVLLGKLAASAALPWLVALVIPATGLVVTNLLHAGSGPHFYPPLTVLAGSGLSIFLAVFLAAGGMLISVGAPTVQHAARRISWFLLPLIFGPGLIVRSAEIPVFVGDSDQIASAQVPEILSSGNLALIILGLLPVLGGCTALLVWLLWRRFGHESVMFN